MGDARMQRGPGLAAADRSRSGAFAALLRRASEDANTADGLALAYHDLPPRERRQIVALLSDDARKERIDVSATIARMLGLERDPTLVRALASALWRTIEHGLPDLWDVPRGENAGALLFRDGDTGEAILLRPQQAGGFEQMEIAWVDGACTRVTISSVPSWSEAVDAAPERLSPSPIRVAVDAVAPVLWRHRRRGGALPAGAANFAPFFAG